MKKPLLFLSLLLTVGIKVNAQDYYPSDSLSTPTWYYEEVVGYNYGNLYNPTTGNYGNAISDAGLDYITTSLNDAYDGAFEFFVNSQDSVYTESGVVDTTGTTFTLAEQLIDGVYLSKSYWFSKTEPVVRAIFKIRNPESTPRTLTAGVYTNFGSDNSTIVDTSYLNNATLEDGDRWMVTTDGYPYDPILTWARFGPGTIASQPHFYYAPEVDYDDYMDTFALVIPANSYVLIMQLNRMDSTTEAARNNVGIFNDVAQLQSAGYLYGISNADLSNIVNWDFSSILCTVDLTTTVSGVTISSNQAGATYQWVNCDSNYSIISGATSQNYTPDLNGNYAVIVTTSNCSDTSACVEISTLGLVDISMFDHVSVKPNPTTGVFTVNSDFESEIEITDIAGHLIRKENLSSMNHTLDISLEENGVYLVVVKIGENKKTYKIVKKD